MASFQVRGIKDETVEALKALAAASGKRGLETYVREVLEAHALQPKQDFLRHIDTVHAMVIREHGGPLTTRSEDLIREDRNQRG